MANKESVGNTVKVALLLCVVCSVFVSAAAVLLRPAQQANKDIDRKTNILAAAGLLKPGLSIDEQFASVTAKAVDLDAGKFTDAVDVSVYDQRKASKDSTLSDELPDDIDIAKISRRIKYGMVYLVENEQGVEKVILPIKGSGLWSTLYGFLALDADFNTVAGIGFYEHAETPGLGGEVDNPLWKAKWIGKRVYSDDSGVALGVIKGEVDTSRPAGVYQIDGLSGATLTSKGVHNLIQFWLGDHGYAAFLTNLKNGEA